MAKVRVFLDTDVVISALLSNKGASFEIIKNKKVGKIISNSVKEEIHEVSRRQKITLSRYARLLQKIRVRPLNLSKNSLLTIYSKYVFDVEDSHVVAGAHKLKTKFLLTHNLRHYKSDKIKNDLGIIVMKPGTFLQYLRSKN